MMERKRRNMVAKGTRKKRSRSKRESRKERRGKRVMMVRAVWRGSCLRRANRSANFTHFARTLKHVNISIRHRRYNYPEYVNVKKMTRCQCIKLIKRQQLKLKKALNTNGKIHHKINTFTCLFSSFIYLVHLLPQLQVRTKLSLRTRSLQVQRKVPQTQLPLRSPLQK